MRFLPLLALVGCGWNLPDQSRTYIDPLWDPSGVITTADGLYGMLPHAGGLVLLKSGAPAERVDIGEGRVTALSVAPDGGPATIAAVVERYRCDTDDKKETRGVKTLADCASDDLKVLNEIDLVRDGVVENEVALDAPFDSLVWSPDGSHAIGWIDLANAADIHGVVNLTSVVVIDAATGDAVPVSVGFAANQVLFDAQGDKAIVLSQSSVAVIDLTTSPPSRAVTFALTLDPHQVVVPVGVALTPDDTHALISVQGKSDLYVLDLVHHSVNIVSLDAAPSAMHVDATDDRTVLVSNQTASVDVVDHDVFDVTRVQLAEPMSAIIDGQGFDLLYGAGKQDVYQLDPVTGDVTTYRLQAPLLSLHLAPTEEFAIALTSESGFGGRPGMEILDLRDGRGHTYPYLLETRGIDVAFTQTDAGLHALVLQSDVSYLYELDLYAGASQELELAEPPIAIGAMASGGFYVTHDDPLGLVSLIDPSTNAIETIAGFGSLGFLDEIGFVVPPGQEQ